MNEAAIQETTPDDLNTLLAEVRTDPAEQAEAIRQRTAQFMGANNVSMMGGWV
jgi:hypothetical protein